MAVPNPIATFAKDPAAILDYAFDWSSFLGDDTIATSTWTLDAGIVKAAEFLSRGLAIIWLSSGTAGTNYNITNHITTGNGRADNRTFRVNVVAT